MKSTTPNAVIGAKKNRHLLTWFTGASAFILTAITFVGGLIATGILGGISTALTSLWLIACLTGWWTVISGRPSWLLLRGGRRTGFMLLALSLVLLIASVVIAGINYGVYDAAVPA